jgi:3-carboxy-cis,cis-muconate cycloisomerase
LPFDALFVPDSIRAAVSDRAWVEAMLEAERAYAQAAAGAGVIPAESAEAITAACDDIQVDPDQLAVEGRRVANPAEPLVRALRETVGGEAAGYVHWGMTSQDTLDTAAMLIVQRAIGLIRTELDAVAAASARLAEEHRGTVMAGRTLLQQAVPITFGLKAASWLVAIVEARGRLGAVRPAAQLGGAAGTLAPLGDRGPDVVRRFAAELGLDEPPLPWHTGRVRIAELGGVLALVAGACAKIALDVVLLAQTEIGEVTTGDDGPSSTMPHKRNPASAVLGLACTRLAQAHAGVLIASLVQEHERAAGAWQAEWPALSGALAYAGGAAAATRATLESLRIDEERMRLNLRDETLSEQAALQPDEHAAGSDPSGYLGSADVFVDRALELYRREVA